MIQLVVILCLASIHLRRDLGLREPLLHGWWSMVATCGGLLALWAVLHGVMVASARSLDRRGSWSTVARADALALGLKLAAGGWFTLCVLLLGWLDGVRAAVGDRVFLDEMIGVSPALAFLVAAWWSAEPIDRRVQEAVMVRRMDEGAAFHPPVPRWAYVWGNARHQVLLVGLPLSLVMIWVELVAHAAAEWFDAASLWPGLVQVAGVGAIFVTSPALLRRVWDTAPMPGSAAEHLVHDVCREHRVRVKGPYLWRTGVGVVNGAILGVLWPFRYVLFSDGLLEHLPIRHVEAVIAHEVAHVRRHHLPWLALSVLATAVGAGLAMSAAAWAGVTHLRFDGKETGAETPASLAVLALSAIVFGMVSRRFEWQADAFAVQHLSRRAGSGVVTADAAEAMSDALRLVAALNGIPERRFSFRHGSIARRRARVAALVGTPVGRAPIDRQVAVIKWSSTVLLACGVAAIFIPLPL